MKTFLCVEDGEFFTVKARDFEHAQEEASMWGAQAIREMTPEEVKSGEVRV